MLFYVWDIRGYKRGVSVVLYGLYTIIQKVPFLA